MHVWCACTALFLQYHCSPTFAYACNVIWCTERGYSASSKKSHIFITYRMAVSLFQYKNHIAPNPKQNKGLFLDLLLHKISYSCLVPFSVIRTSGASARSGHCSCSSIPHVHHMHRPNHNFMKYILLKLIVKFTTHNVPCHSRLCGGVWVCSLHCAGRSAPKFNTSRRMLYAVAPCKFNQLTNFCTQNI